MSSLRTMSLLPRRTTLPWDVLLLVFQECDPSTLAILGGVSLDFLAATSPHLYGSIEVQSVEQLARLFCERDECLETSLPSRINPYLSLSQTRSLTVGFTSVPTLLHHVHLSFTLLVSDPLPIETLNVRLPYVSWAKNITYPFEYLSKNLLRHLNPIRVRYDSERPSDKGVWDWSNDSKALEGWTRLERVDYVGSIPMEGIETERLSCLPPAQLSRRRTLRFYVTTLLCLYTPRNYLTFAKFFHVSRRRFSLDKMQDGSIVFVVETEQQKTEVEAGILVQIEPKWRSIFVVEVEV